MDDAAACTGFKSGVVRESKTKHQMLNGCIVFSTERLLLQKNYHKNFTKY